MQAQEVEMRLIVRDYLELCKPRVVMLMILTSIVGMCLAPSPSFPIWPLIFGNLGIALVAGSAAAINHVDCVLMDATTFLGASHLSI